MQLKSTRLSVYLFNYHIIFIPKYRRHVLTGKIAEKIKEIFYEIAYKYGIEIIALEVMETTYIYLYQHCQNMHHPTL